MPRFRAIYRDHLSDRNPVREEVILEAESAEAAIAQAKKRATASFQLLEVVLVENGPEDDKPDGPASTAARNRS